MSLRDRIDAVTLDDLEATGATKWSMTPGAIGAFVAEMDFGIAPPITAALHDAVDSGSFGYMPRCLATELSEATAGWFDRRYGWNVSPERISGLPDVITALQVTIANFSEPGGKVIVPTPAYMPFLFVPQTMGREVIEVPLVEDGGRFGFDLDALQRAFDDGGRLLVLCNPMNPVGRVLGRAELEAIAEVVERNGGRVFVDEIWAPLVFPGSQHLPYASLSAEAAAHSVTATSASKAWNLPGLKCAQLVLTNDEDLGVWKKIGPMAGHGTANLGVIANTVAYLAGGEWLDEVVDYLDGNRRELEARVREQLPGVRYTVPDGTYVGWLDFRGTGLESPAKFFATEADVILTDGIACGAAGAGAARFIFAMPRPILRTAIERMGEAFARRG